MVVVLMVACEAERALGWWVVEVSDKNGMRLYCVRLWANAFCWANCNLSFLREINDVFKNQNENWYFRIYSRRSAFFSCCALHFCEWFVLSSNSLLLHRFQGVFGRNFKNVYMCVCVSYCVSLLCAYTQNMYRSFVVADAVVVAVVNRKFFVRIFFHSLSSPSFCSSSFSVRNFTVCIIAIGVLLSYKWFGMVRWCNIRCCLHVSEPFFDL